jgi:hypothetical protein
MSVQLKELTVDPKVWYFIQGYKSGKGGVRPQSFSDLNFVPEGLQYFSQLLNVDNNPIATASYGGGTHAVEAKHISKYDLWGGRILNDNPLKCHFIFDGDDLFPLGFFNLGVTGSPATVTGPDSKQVIEFGVFFADKTFVNEPQTSITASFDMVSQYLEDQHTNGRLQDYAVVMGTFAKDHPWAAQVLSSTQLQKVTPNNCKEVFGSDAPFNAQRFQFNANGEIEECGSWNKEGICDQWVEKDMFALNFLALAGASQNAHDSTEI